LLSKLTKFSYFFHHNLWLYYRTAKKHPVNRILRIYIYCLTFSPDEEPMKMIPIVLLVLVSTYLFGQNKHLGLGIKRYGLSIGNSANYNGIRINFEDKNVNEINGLNIAGISDIGKLNGMNIGILFSLDSLSNGIEIGGLSLKFIKHNGFALGTLCLTGEKINGIGITGLALFADTLNGVFVGPIGIMPRHDPDSIRIINGLSIGGGVIASKMNGVSFGYFGNIFEKLNGVAIGGINLASELHGFQIGLINHAHNNRRFFRWTPIVNFNLRQKP
jgi:hypothetical protein